MGSVGKASDMVLGVCGGGGGELYNGSDPVRGCELGVANQQTIVHASSTVLSKPSVCLVCLSVSSSHSTPRTTNLHRHRHRGVVRHSAGPFRHPNPIPLTRML